MNEPKRPQPPRPPRAHALLSGRSLVALCMALLILSLAFAAPVLAAAFPSALEQGTVPPPPPGPGGGDEDDDDDDRPAAATATPAPAGEAAAGEPSAAQAPEDAEATAAAYAGVVLSPRLNLRSGPATAFPAIGQLLQNESVIVQFRDGTNDWWYTCCISGTTTSGWVSASFIRTEFAQAEGVTLLPLFPEIENLPTPVPATPAPATTAAAVATPRPINGDLTAVVDAQPRLIVRDAPGTEGVILGRVADGATVEVIARNEAGDWWYICCIDNSNTEGWANAAFLTSNFNVANAMTLIPVFGAPSSVQLPTPTPTPRGLPVITKMPKVVDVTPTPVTVVVPTAAPTSTPTQASTPTPAPTATSVPATPVPATPVPTATEVATLESTATPESATPESATPEATSTALPEEEETPQAAYPTTLEAVMWQEPAFAAPGDMVVIRYLITNQGNEAARAVEVRNELPAELQLGQGAGSDNARFTQEQTSAGATVVSLLWEAVPAGKSVSGTVAVQILPDLAPGSVLFNIASIGALNAAVQSAAITISTPPAALPDFQ